METTAFIAVRSFISSGFNVNSPLTPGFESRIFKDFWISRMIGAYVFVLAQCLYVEDYFIPFFSPMCYTSAKGLIMKVPYNNNLPTQTNDVMVNPENPDSKLAAAPVISTEEWVHFPNVGISAPQRQVPISTDFCMSQKNAMPCVLSPTVFKGAIAIFFPILKKSP
jgi:hypothetical protein